MMALVLRSTRWRLVAGGVCALALALALPERLSARLWWAAAAGAVLTPWLVLGRERLRQRQGWRDAAAAAVGRRALVALELVAPALVVVAAAVAVTRGIGGAAWALSAWGIAVLALADALDRRCATPGTAWLISLFSASALWTAPWWLARWFGRTALAPHLATDAIGLHPAGTALAAAGRPVLQDPWFYEWTLSGVVMALPTPWYRGIVLYGILAALAIGFAIHSAGRIDSRRFS